MFHKERNKQVSQTIVADSVNNTLRRMQEVRLNKLMEFKNKNLVLLELTHLKHRVDQYCMTKKLTEVHEKAFVANDLKNFVHKKVINKEVGKMLP